MSEARSAGSAPAAGAGISPLGRVRIVVRVVAMVAALLVAVPLHYVWRLFAYGSPMPRLVLGVIARIIGARVRVIGTPLRRDVFFLANHLTWLDIPAIAGASGTAFVAKSEVAKTPVIGWLCRLNRTVFVQREARLNVAEQINAVREALSDNRAITVFPEGTTTDGRSLLPFKSSILKALEPPPPGILVQPVLVDYGPLGEEVCWIGEEEGMANALRVLARRGSFPLRIHFLEPFSPESYPGRKVIAAEARNRIEHALVSTLGQPLRPFALDVAAIGYSSRAPGPAHDRAEGED
ncbi:MAG TPA: lysophospholipid acyltransferase family protein [Novosphingobium sp.]